MNRKFIKYIGIIIFSFQLNNISKAQEIINNNQLEQYVDVDGQFIIDYIDDDYNAKHPIVVSYVIGSNYTPGYYYNLEGQRIKGFFRYNSRDTYPKFKTSEKGKSKKLKPNNCLSYVIGYDSITVIKNFNVQYKSTVFNYDKPQFAWVIGNVGNLTFYRHIRAESTDGYSYLARKNGETEYINFPNTPKNPEKFKEIAISVFDNFKYLKQGIKTGKYLYNDIPEMIKILEYKEKFDNNEKIYYNSLWDESANNDDIQYYGIIESLEDSIFNMAFYDIHGVIIYRGGFTSFLPKKRHGTFFYYYPDGRIRKQINYKDNQPQESKLFYKNGNIHRTYSFSENTTKYAQVNDIAGYSILDNTGNGIEILTDSTENRKIYNEYKNFKLASSYYLDSNGEKTYQYCEKNADPRNHSLYRIRIKNNTDCMNCCNNVFRHGYVLAKYTIEPSGFVSKINLIKGIDKACDANILAALVSVRNEYNWKPGIVGGIDVKQEVVLPIHFSVRWFSWSNEYNIDYSGRIITNMALYYLNNMQFVP